MGFFEWLIAIVCVSGLVIGIMYGANYARTVDYGNQTDTFGTAPSTYEKTAINSAEVAAKGGTAVSGGLLIFGAAIFTGICVFFGWTFMKHARW